MVWLIALAFPVFFGAMWVGIVSFLAWASGWYRLGKTYGVDRIPEDFVGRRQQTVTLGHGRFPRVHYRGMLWIGFARDRLMIKPHILFRWAHPPLVIPRDQVRAVERRGLIRRFVAVSTTAHPAISLHLRVQQFDWAGDIQSPDV